MRATGPINQLTRQPLKGRKKHGGIRLGEMERDSIIAHGAAFLLHERLLNSSDRHMAVVCDRCGSILSATAKQLTQQEAASATSVTLVFLSVLLTALGLYHRLARYAGAGTLVPITGFANAVASPAIDFRAEGIVTGTAVKMFTVAGPVIVFGTAASVVYGLVLYLLG
mgnify:CR=1 FL=1